MSTEKIKVDVIYKAVGQISESDVTLADASDAIIVGFQVRPSAAARKLAEQEGVEINTYSVIYDAIDDVKSAMIGMLDKVKKEVITGQVEVREVYKISKVGTVAGCYSPRVRYIVPTRLASYATVSWFTPPRLQPSSATRTTLRRLPPTSSVVSRLSTSTTSSRVMCSRPSQRLRLSRLCNNTYISKIAVLGISSLHGNFLL